MTDLIKFMGGDDVSYSAHPKKNCKIEKNGKYVQGAFFLLWIFSGWLTFGSSHVTYFIITRVIYNIYHNVQNVILAKSCHKKAKINKKVFKKH